MKKQIIPFSNHEIVIEYITPYSKGTMIMDLNFYSKYHKVIMRKLKDCEITSMIERRKENA